MASPYRIFGQGLKAEPLRYIGTPPVTPDFNAEPRPVYIENLPGADFTQAAAQADSTATTVAGLVTDFNALLAKLRTAGVIDS